ncbi:MAG: hypothetical protein EH225_11555 [Calditrichaeota bacterium]|nr:hypothetical protein [Calditrichota bacterium]RQV99446.1 MAG: hypothetical protein EH225_11555 [Calditrichota bacterium]
MKNQASHLSLIQRSRILLQVLRKDDPETLYADLTSIQLKEMRNFLEQEIIFLSRARGLTISEDDLRRGYPSVQEYYRKQDCHEPLESCIDETCLLSNPVCFGMKMKNQIGTLLEKLVEYI